MKISILACLGALFLVVGHFPDSAQAESLGNKYDCRGSSLRFKGKVISLRVAKKNITSLSKPAQATIQNLPQGNPQRIKLSRQVSSLKKTLGLVKDCAAGKYVPKIFHTIAGSYSVGSWHNTTFDTTGGISANISLNGTLLSVSINIGGFMFGSLTPAPIEFEHDVGGAIFPLNFTVENTSIGKLEVTINSNGSLNITETAVPGLGFILRATLEASFANGIYTGSFRSLLLNEIQLAEGSIELRK